MISPAWIPLYTCSIVTKIMEFYFYNMFKSQYTKWIALRIRISFHTYQMLGINSGISLSTGTRNGIYLGTADVEKDIFAIYKALHITNIIITRSIFHEHYAWAKPLDKFTDKLATLEKFIVIYSYESCTRTIPDVSNDHVLTVIYELCLLRIDLVQMSAQQ